MEVYGASGYRPYLELNGIMLRNGSGIDGIGYIGGGGLRALRGDVYVSHCIIRKNQANLWGAGVYAQEATLQIYSSLVDSNTNTQTDCGGGLTSTAGGVGFNNSNTSIANTTVKANKACRGGGVAYGGYGNFTMENSTLSGNVAKARGGGLFLQYGTGSVVLRFNTIAFNTAGASGTSEWRYGGGFGMFNFSGNLESYGNIIAKNTVTYTDRNHLVWYDGHDCYADGGSVAASTIKYLYNMVGIIDNCSYYLGSSGSGWAGAPMDPRLQPLATAGRDNYGFALPVHMPYYYSPVVNGYAPQGGANQNCPNYDERGFFRPHANDAQPYCDQGAAEYNGFTQ
jgi:hypothetical protein